jgi:hypothetical protein
MLQGNSGSGDVKITAIGENELQDTVSTVSRVSDNGRGAPLKEL